MLPTPPSQPHDRFALILYGSETGNSHDVAQRLGAITERLHFKTIVTEMDNFASITTKKLKSGEIKQIPTLKLDVLRKATLIVLVTSTAGQGEFPKNTRRFWRSLLRKNLSPDSLKGVDFTTFGLGDSSYPKFNRASRLLQVRFQGLGANEVFARGEADDQHQDGYDGALLPWTIEFQAQLQSLYPLPEGVNPIPPEVLLPFKWTHQLDLESPSLSATAQNPEAIDNDSKMKLYHPTEDYTLDVQCPMLKEPFPPADLKVDPPLRKCAFVPIPYCKPAVVAENRRLTPTSHWQDVREITFHVTGDISYKPGDTLTIFPQNFPEDVQTLIDLMDWNDVADTPLKFQVEGPAVFFDEFLVSPAPKDFHPLPKSTLRQLLRYNLDITAIPQRNILDILAHYTNDPDHKQRLAEFSNIAYTDEFFDYATRPRRSILEVLQDFHTVKLPFNIVTAIFPTLRGRPYSICSGGILKVHTKDITQIQILVAIVNYKTVLSKVRHGLCTRYLAALREGTELPVRLDFEDGFYRDIEYKPTVPIILVAPGTGLAPCRSLIWERRETAYKGIKFGRSYLFFGGRNEKADFFYDKEWQNEVNKVTVFPAFSRDGKDGRKVYVQDKIREQGELVHRLLMEEGAYIFVCGSAGSMPSAVRDAFVDVFEEWGGEGTGREEAEKDVARLEGLGRYKQETW